MRVVQVDAEHLRELAVVDELTRTRSLNEPIVDRLVLHGQLLPIEIIADEVKNCPQS